MNAYDKVTDHQVNRALDLISEYYPVSKFRAQHSIKFKFSPSANRNFLIRSLQDNSVAIEFSDLAMALRAFGRLLAQPLKCDSVISEATPFMTMAVMLDCARGSVPKTDYLKNWLRKMALLGFNMAMLYTEDNYELPGEEYFGYKRGRYSPSELKEIDVYARSLGIEMVGCIQTLGHLEQVLKWDAYREIADTSKILRVGWPRTYKLIEKMIAFYSENYQSKRIHVGMDEPEYIGRGACFDTLGFRKPQELMSQHLQHVGNICQKFGLKPMIWSDSLFRNGCRLEDYNNYPSYKSSVNTDHLSKFDLVFWDYYRSDEEYYTRLIQSHCNLGSKPVVSTGIWTWNLFWYSRQLTEKTVEPCLNACRKAGISEILFTLWGDDGAYCNFDSAWAGLAYSSELAFCEQISQQLLQKRFAAVCKADYAATCLASEINLPTRKLKNNEFEVHFADSAFFWDDPLLAIYWHNQKIQNTEFWFNLAQHYKSLLPILKKCSLKNDSINHALIIAKVIASKIEIQMLLDRYYPSRDYKGLQLVCLEVRNIIRMLFKLDKSFRSLWMEQYKPYGLESLQLRLSGLIRRYMELSDRISELNCGKINHIEELDSNVKRSCSLGTSYKSVASGTVF